MGQYDKPGIYKDRVGVQVVTSRADYLAVLLTSLRTQTYKEWDLILVYQDEKIVANRVVNVLLSRIENEGHRIKLLKTDVVGLGALRNLALSSDNCEYGLRVDDDSMCEPDYIERLMEVMKDTNAGIVGGIVPFMSTKNYAPVKEHFNKIEDGNITDDCIFFYNTLQEHFPSDHIRSSFLYKNEDAMKLMFPTYNDDKGAFREETDFCIRMKLILKKDIRFVPSAVCWHLLAEYAGTRSAWKEGIAKQADDLFRVKVKEYESGL